MTHETNTSTMRILFVSRAFPPIVGGIENQNAGIAKSLGEIANVTTLINPYGKKFLPIFLPYAAIKMLCHASKYDAILIGDGVLSPLAAMTKKIHPHKTFGAIIHGLDITYANKDSLMGKIYRKVNIPALKDIDKLIMVGRFTIDEAVKVGLQRERCTFIPNGYTPQDFEQSFSRSDLSDFLDMSLEKKKVVLRVGRFVQHKGVPWFLENVLPSLPADVIFIAAGGRVGTTLGDGDAFLQAQKIIREKGLEERVILKTDLRWEDIKMLYKTADIYVSPNVDIKGSAEGFGINAIEASASGCTVLASNFQGLKDAVIEGQNGFLVAHEDANAWIVKIEELLSTDFDRKQFGEHATKFTRENFSWKKIAHMYLNELHR